MQTER